MTRAEVKEALFESVFYINTPHADVYNDIAKSFSNEFPEVFKQIDWWKSTDNRTEILNYLVDNRLYADKISASLSVAMMGLEAQIFTSILKKIYSKKWNAIHVHDCIVVPKDGNKNHPTMEQVLAIMKDVYKEYGLSPTFDA